MTPSAYGGVRTLRLGVGEGDEPEGEVLQRAAACAQEEDELDGGRGAQFVDDKCGEGRVRRGAADRAEEVAVVGLQVGEARRDAGRRGVRDDAVFRGFVALGVD